MILSAGWSAEERILRTRLGGILQAADVRAWEEALERAAAEIPPLTSFAMLVDIEGYEVSEQEQEVHRLQRVVVPIFLARHGFEVGFFRLMEEQNTVPQDPDGATCVAVAHVHHDCAKMERYREILGTGNEQFFCDRAAAEAWLREVAPASLAKWAPSTPRA